MKFAIDKFKCFYYLSYYEYNDLVGTKKKLPLLCTRDVAKNFGLTIKTFERLIKEYNGFIRFDRPYFKNEKDAELFKDMFESLELMRKISDDKSEI